MSANSTWSGSQMAAWSPKRRPVRKKQAHHDMADDDDGEIRRRVVGAMMVQFFAARGAFIRFQIAPVHGASAARRASEFRTSEHGR